MSLSINKLLEVLNTQGPKDARQSSNDKLNKELKPEDVPLRFNNLTASQYYASVKYRSKNSQNILMKDTPDGHSDMPHLKAREDPHGFTEDGWIDPTNRREYRDPLHAPAPDYYEGQDNVLYGLPKSTLSQNDNVGLLQKARASYISRINMYNAPPKGSAPAQTIPDG